MLSAGMIFLAKAPSSSETSPVDPIENYKDLQENYFLETDSLSYSPFESFELGKKGIDYKLVKVDTVDYSKIPSESNYISNSEVRRIIDSLYSNSWAPKIVSADQYESFILKESSLDANSYNEGSGASGLSQVRAPTWGDVMPLDSYVLERFNPKKSLEAGLRYVSWLEKALPKLNPNWVNFNQDEKVRGIIQGYNHGIGNMEDKDWDVAKIPKETKDYEAFVLGGEKV